MANAGDSRCVLSRGGKAIDLSVDHKPEDAVEKERIDKAGGFVTSDGRVNGNLNLSRAIGQCLSSLTSFHLFIGHSLWFLESRVVPLQQTLRGF